MLVCGSINFILAGICVASSTSGVLHLNLQKLNSPIIPPWVSDIRCSYTAIVLFVLTSSIAFFGWKVYKAMVANHQVPQFQEFLNPTTFLVCLSSLVILLVSNIIISISIAIDVSKSINWGLDSELIGVIFSTILFFALEVSPTLIGQILLWKISTNFFVEGYVNPRFLPHVQTLSNNDTNKYEADSSTEKKSSKWTIKKTRNPTSEDQYDSTTLFPNSEDSSGESFTNITTLGSFGSMGTPSKLQIQYQ